MSREWQEDDAFEPPPNVWDHYAAAALAALLGRGWDVATALETAESVADEMMVRRAE
jgi:hypothetical protein